MIKLTIKFINEQFQKEGYILLTKEYKNAWQKLDYICPKGHKHSICWHGWKQGRRCLECGGSKRLTIEYIKEQFLKEDYILLTEEYINSNQKLEYICPKGHSCNISWRSWCNGSRCMKCSIENKTGKNNYRWNFNLTDEEREKKRKKPENKQWIKAVYERNNFSCQCCGKRGGNLEAHHLENWADNPELRYDIDNGVTLCKECHRTGPNAFHKIYGIHHTTTLQTNEFLNKKEK